MKTIVLTKLKTKCLLITYPCTHFKNLHRNPNPTRSLKNEIFTLEKFKETHNYIDDPFSLKEIDTAAKLFKKSKKTPGSDQIRNEMLKTGIQYLKVAISKLFNLILKCGFFPISWCQGIITPIYKSGRKSDPSHYLNDSFQTTAHLTTSSPFEHCLINM